MVSVGTILTVGIIGAIAAGGYAVYRNSGKLGSAVSRGVEETLVNPLGRWADSLWSSIANPFESSTSGPSSIAGQTVDLYGNTTVTIPSDTVVNPDKTVTSSTPPLLNLAPEEKDLALIAFKQNKSLSELALGQEGYYYFNVAGSIWDTQQFLSSEAALKLSTAEPNILFNQEGLQNIKYIGKAPLQEAGFKLFGSSQNYL